MLLGAARAPARDAAMQSQMGAIASTAASNTASMNGVALASMLIAGGMATTPAAKEAVDANITFYGEQTLKLHSEVATRTQETVQLCRRRADWLGLVW